MSSGYDTSCTTLSQEGRLYQIEYANKPIENSSTVLGIILKDGVVLITPDKEVSNGDNREFFNSSWYNFQ